MANLCLHLFVRLSFALGVDVQHQCLGTWRPRLPIAFRCPRLRLAVTSCIHPAAPPNLLPRQKTCTRTVSRKYLHLHCERCLSACLSVDEDRFRCAFAVPFLRRYHQVTRRHLSFLQTSRAIRLFPLPDKNTSYPRVSDAVSEATKYNVIRYPSFPSLASPFLLSSLLPLVRSQWPTEYVSVPTQR